MNILGIDTATDRLSAALIANGKESERHTDSRSSHCELLTGFISDLVEEADISMNEIDGIAVSLGPGSFTGLRIGIASAMGAAYGLGIKTVGINTLMGLAWNTGIENGYVCTLIDAKRAEVYAAVYHVKGSSEAPEEIMTPIAIPLADLAGKLQEYDAMPLLAGPASTAFKDKLEELLPEASFVQQELAKPSALSIAQIGEIMFTHGEGSDPSALTPLYLRRSDAEILRDKRRLGVNANS